MTTWQLVDVVANSSINISRLDSSHAARDIGFKFARNTAHYRAALYFGGDHCI